MSGDRRRRRAALLAAGALLALVALAVVSTLLTGSGNGPGSGSPNPATTSSATSGTPTSTPSTAATGSAPSPAAQRQGLPAPAGQVFGVSVNRLFNDFSYAPAQIDAQLAAVRATGATIARSDALWEATEPGAPVDGRHSYDWAFDDEIARSLAAHDLAWLPIIDYTAPWDQSIPGQDHSPPLSDAGYADYAAAFAARYGPGGSFWAANPGLRPEPVTTIEIWNEPDSPEFWLPSPDPAAYAGLYLAARAAIDRVVPTIRVIVGGLTDPARFLPAMVSARPLLRAHVDGVAIHPYGSPAVVIARVRAARAALVSLGMASVPLYVTEFGWTTSPPGAPDYAAPTVRNGYIVRTLAALGHLRCGLAASLLYTWVTPEADPRDAQDWYGIADPVATAPTASTEAFAAGLAAAGGPEPAAAPAPCPS